MHALYYWVDNVLVLFQKNENNTEVYKDQMFWLELESKPYAREGHLHHIQQM